MREPPHRRSAIRAVYRSRHMPQAIIPEMPPHDLRFETNDRYRTVAEERIVDFLLSPFEVAAGARALDLLVAKGILDRCIALGLPYRSSKDDRRLFDPVEVRNFIKYAHFRWNEPIWRDRTVLTLRRLMAQPISSPSKSTDYEVKIVRKFNLTGHQVGEFVRLALPLPIEDLTTAPNLSSFLPLDANDVQTDFDEARLNVRFPVTESKSAEIGVCIRLICPPKTEQQAPKIDRDEIALYTRKSEGLIKLNQRITDLAKRLVGQESDRWSILHRIWDFMFDELTLGAIHYDKLHPRNPLDWTLDNCLYDCRVGSALVVALCRARGIPARLVSGYTINPVLPTMHTWIEVWFDDNGWLPFDLYSMELCGGDRDSAWRHYFFGRIDHRLITERLPRLFGGLGSVRLPVGWQLISATHDDGALLSFEDLTTGELIYSEKISVRAAG